MARVTHVKKAQQRYATKPVLDDQGQPVKIALTKADGSPKMTRAKGNRPARPVFITKTVADKSKPKPLLRCDFPGCQIDGGTIAIGTPYKWVKPKSGPYGGHQRNRHAAHPSWKPWDLSSSLSARAMEVSHNATTALEEVTCDDDVTQVLDDAASAIRDDLAASRTEAADNMEEGFGHETGQSEQLREDAETLEGWADEVESADFTTLEDFLADQKSDCETCSGEGSNTEPCDSCSGDGEDEAGETCPECNGSGEQDEDCQDCDGSGQVDVDPENVPDDLLDEWRTQVQEELSVLDECPV